MLLSENLISESDLLVVRDTKGSLEISTPNTKKPWNKNKLKKKKSNSRHTKITENGNTDWLSWWTILVIFLMFCASNTVHKKDCIKQTEMSVIHLIFILFNYFYSLGIRHWAWLSRFWKNSGWNLIVMEHMRNINAEISVWGEDLLENAPIKTVNWPKCILQRVPHTLALAGLFS